MEPKFHNWSISYNLDGSQWVLHVMAKDADDAMRRIKQAATWGTVDGREVYSIKIAPDWAPRLCGWVRNAFSR